MRKHKGLEEGIAVLVDTNQGFPDHPTVTYYLGSYNYIGRDVESVRALVNKEIQFDKSLKKVAI